MPGDSLKRLRISELGLIQRLGGGGQGVVFTAPNLKMRQYPSSLVYKEYKSKVLGSLDVSVLEAMPEYLESLPMSEGMKIFSACAWPCRLVEGGGGAIAGFVMPKIPDQFFLDMKKVSGTSRELGEFQHLLNGDRFLAMRGIPLSDRHRYELLADAARALEVFHQHDIAVGDLSPKNMLFGLQPHSRVYFIDCDAMRFRGESVAKQLETPDWEIPSGEELATPHSDMYKFGLMVLRLLVSDQSTRDAKRLPRSVPSEVKKLITGTLGAADPADRPSPPDWQNALDAAAQTASTSPPAKPAAAAPQPAPAAPQPTPARPAAAIPLHTPAAAQPTPLPAPPGQPLRTATPHRPQTFTPPRQNWFRRQPTSIKAAIVIIAVAVIGSVLGRIFGNSGNSSPSSGTVAPPPPVTAEPAQPDLTLGPEIPSGAAAFSFAGQSESRYSSSYWAEVTDARLTSDLTLQVEFESFGTSDLRPPASSCLVHSDTGSIASPVGERITTSRPDHYAGALLFPVLMRGEWGFQYSCGEFSVAPLGVLSSTPVIGTKYDSATNYASVIDVRFEDDTVTVDVAAHGDANLADPDTSCLDAKWPIGSTTSAASTTSFYVASLRFPRPSRSPVEFIYACDSFTGVSLRIPPQAAAATPGSDSTPPQTSLLTPDSDSGFTLDLDIRAGTLLPNLARIRSEPRLDAPIVGSLADQQGTSIKVIGQHVDGWYPIERNGQAGWIFAAFVTPSDDGIWVIRTKDRMPLELYDSSGDSLARGNESGSFGLATSVSGRLWRLLLPDGTTAYARSEAVEIYE